MNTAQGSSQLVPFLLRLLAGLRGGLQGVFRFAQELDGCVVALAIVLLPRGDPLDQALTSWGLLSCTDSHRAAIRITSLIGNVPHLSFKPRDTLRQQCQRETFRCLFLFRHRRPTPPLAQKGAVL